MKFRKQPSEMHVTLLFGSFYSKMFFLKTMIKRKEMIFDI